MKTDWYSRHFRIPALERKEGGGREGEEEETFLKNGLSYGMTCKKSFHQWPITSYRDCAMCVSGVPASMPVVDDVADRVGGGERLVQPERTPESPPASCARCHRRQLSHERPIRPFKTTWSSAMGRKGLFRVHHFLRPTRWPVLTTFVLLLLSCWSGSFIRPAEAVFANLLQPTTMTAAHMDAYRPLREKESMFLYIPAKLEC